MPLKALQKPEVAEYMMPVFFIGIAYKFAFYNVFKSVPAYQKAQILGEAVWAVIFLSVGILMFAATLSRVYKLRFLALTAAALIWWYWAAAILQARSAGFGDVIWTLLAVMTSWTLARLKNLPVK